MKRNFKSMLAGLLALSMLPVVPVEISALDWGESMVRVVVGVNEKNYIVADKNGTTYSIQGGGNLLPTGSEPLVPGDVIEIDSGWCGTPAEVGVTHELTPMTTYEPETGMLRKIGSVMDEGETATFTVIDMSGWCRVTDGSKAYIFYTDWMDWEGYTQLGNVDWSAVEVGDTLECYVVNGVPVIVKEEVQTDEIGLWDEYFILTGVNENNDYVVVNRQGNAYYLDRKQVAEALPEGSEPLALGDVFHLRQDVNYFQTALGGNCVNSMSIYAWDDREGKEPLKPGTIQKTGSVLDEMQTAEFKVSIDGDGLYYLSNDTTSQQMVTYWQMNDQYQRLGQLDWNDVKPGDFLNCIVYDGRPVIALNEVGDEETAPLKWDGMVVVGVSNRGIIVAARNGETYWVLGLSDAIPEGEARPGLGEMISLHGGWCRTEIYERGTDEFATMSGDEYIERHGSILDDPETALFTVTELSDYCMLSDGEREYLLCTDWMDWEHNFEQLGNVDWSAVAVGDTLECYVVEGVPVIAREKVQDEEPAEISYSMIIVGMNEGGKYVALDKDGYAFYLSGEQLSQGLPKGSEKLVPGDVIGFTRTVGLEATELGGNAVNSARIILFDEEFHECPLEPGTIVKVDSVLNEMQTAEYTVSTDGWGLYYLNDDAGSYQMVTYWQREDWYQQLGKVNWAEVKPGDTLKCIVYDGRPVIALEKMEPLPDDGRIWFTCDTFRYGVYERTDNNGKKHYSGGILESDVDANFVVTGVFYNEGSDTPCLYTLNSLKQFGEKNMQFTAGHGNFEEFLNGQVLKPGDVLCIKNAMVAEVYPACLHMSKADGASLEVLGSGVDVFGEDFKKVLYYEMYDEPLISWEDAPLSESGYVYELYNNDILDTGNLNNDGKINLLDVVALNKNLMTGYQLGSYAKGCADVDSNGTVDAVDSLNILKYCIGLVESFEELQ